VLYVDLHLIHEVTSPQAFSLLKSLGLPVRRPDRTLATMDHSTPTSTDQVFGKVPIKVDAAAKQVRQLEQNAAEFGVELFGMRDARRGIVHVISPELGATQPGMTIVCGDSHTSTHGAFGALAFGIGTTEVGHVFATQSLLQRKPKTFAVNVEGQLGPGVTAKDLILAVIGKIGVSGGTGHVFEYRGSAIRALSMDERMTVCNMSIEAGARAGMIAPDDITFAYLEGKPRAPKAADWDAAVARWRTFVTDPGAVFDASLDIDASALEPMITYGTNPGMVLPIGASIPDRAGDPVFDKALRYMGFHGGGGGLARVRLLDVLGDERRHRRRRPVFDQHQQSQLRGPPRRRGANSVGQSIHRGGERREGQDYRPPGDAVVEGGAFPRKRRADRRITCPTEMLSWNP
jgi:3-isopropylmalate/(R)-2-methylmalate dehydratase large subunit